AGRGATRRESPGAPTAGPASQREGAPGDPAGRQRAARGRGVRRGNGG
ncbi:MAG: hypothetical protein AVDCRST_MAG01-01-1859, partial [uncultured Rubrobacteraceae bacterium]